MIYIMSTVLSTINFRSFDKGFESFVAKFYLAESSLMNDLMPALFLDSCTLTRSSDGSSLYKSFPNEQGGLWDTPAGCSLWYIPSTDGLNFAPWTDIKEKCSKCLGATRSWPPLLCPLHEMFPCVGRLAWLLCRDSWVKMSGIRKLLGLWCQISALYPIFL